MKIQRGNGRSCTSCAFIAENRKRCKVTSEKVEEKESGCSLWQDAEILKGKRYAKKEP